MRGKAEGTLVASKPLSYNGELIEDFSITFKNGKVSEVHARKNQKLLEHMVSMDEGAAQLGEVALVPYTSPINLSGLLFYNIYQFLTTIFRELVLMNDGVVFFSRESVDEIVAFFEVLSKLVFEVGVDGQHGFKRETGVSFYIGPVNFTFPSVVTFPETGQTVEDSLHRHFIVVIGEMIFCHCCIVSVLISMTAGKN